jgi:UDP-N-acetyl-D-galactosamine dehydrogenase
VIGGVKEGPRIGVIGLGYVGLPLAMHFGREHHTVGFDISTARVAALREGVDATGEASPEDFAAATMLKLSNSLEDLRGCNTYIVTVPTPIDASNRPDLRPLKSASESLGKVLEKGDVVVYESTVYPGCTEEVCVPILERISGLKYNEDFYAGYSPERINPGDREHKLPNILKVTTGSTPEAADYVDAMYASIIQAGTHKASSIRVAEAAKVIENTQRDLNIALVNELALIFNKMGIDTLEVLQAAGTKWNFLPFRPGLVGGHCIGVDPYYLTHKAQELGYHPEVILAGRRINDGMGKFVAGQVLRLMAKRDISMPQARVLVLGLAFKENCPDLRNTRVVDILQHFQAFNVRVDVHDPWVDAAEAKHEYDIDLVAQPEPGAYDAIVVAVAHREFAALGADGLRALGKPNAVLYDVKYVLPKADVDGRL